MQCPALQELTNHLGPFSVREDRQENSLLQPVLILKKSLEVSPMCPLGVKGELLESSWAQGGFPVGCAPQFINLQFTGYS